MADPLAREPVSEAHRYAFEERETSYRDPSKARAEAHKFVARAHLPLERFDAELGALLLQYATDYHLNLVWYARELKARRRWQTFLWILVVGLAFGGAATMLKIEAAVPLSQLGVLVFAVLLGLQFVANVTDVKAQIGLLWEASAQLKEQLYLFEEQCRHFDWSQPDALAKLRLELEAQIREARRIVREEQTRFFAAMRSPSDGINALVTLTDSLRSRRPPAPPSPPDASGS